MAEPAPVTETDPERIANSGLSATHRDGGGHLYKVCDMSGRWLRFGNICWSFASSDPEAVPAGLKELIRLDPFGPRDADGWYTWNGDDTMRPAGQVEYKMRASGSTDTGDAEHLRWDHQGGPGDIVSWRPAQESTASRQCAAGSGHSDCWHSALPGSKYCREHQRT